MHLGLGPVGNVAAPVADLTAASLPCPSRKNVGRDMEQIADFALDRVAPPSISGSTRSMMTPLGGPADSINGNGR
jgi:hypothetical protein